MRGLLGEWESVVESLHSGPVSFAKIALSAQVLKALPGVYEVYTFAKDPGKSLGACENFLGDGDDEYKSGLGNFSCGHVFFHLCDGRRS